MADRQTTPPGNLKQKTLLWPGETHSGRNLIIVNLPINQPDSVIDAANNGSDTGKPGKEPPRAHHEARKTTPERDLASAREAERRILEAENAGWLAQNVHALLALAIMFITFALFVFIIHASMDSTFKESDAKDIVIYILGALTTVATQIVSYYFGSSSGSADKSRALSTIAKRG